MRGHWRIRKKHLKQAGWQIVGDGKEDRKGHYLVLQKPDEGRVTAVAATRPYAYYQAEPKLPTIK